MPNSPLASHTATKPDPLDAATLFIDAANRLRARLAAARH